MLTLFHALAGFCFGWLIANGYGAVARYFGAIGGSGLGLLAGELVRRTLRAARRLMRGCSLSGVLRQVAVGAVLAGCVIGTLLFWWACIQYTLE